MNSSSILEYLSSPRIHHSHNAMPRLRRTRLQCGKGRELRNSVLVGSSHYAMPIIEPVACNSRCPWRLFLTFRESNFKHSGEGSVIPRTLRTRHSRRWETTKKVKREDISQNATKPRPGPQIGIQTKSKNPASTSVQPGIDVDSCLHRHDLHVRLVVTGANLAVANGVATRGSGNGRHSKCRLQQRRQGVLVDYSTTHSSINPLNAAGTRTYHRLILGGQRIEVRKRRG